MSSPLRRWTVGAVLAAVLLTGCDLGTPDRAVRSPAPTPTGVTATPATPGSATPGPSPSAVVAMVSSDGGPLTAAETRAAVASCLGARAGAKDITAATVEYARDIAYLTDDVRTLPVIVIRSHGDRIVCNKDGRVTPTSGATREPGSAHPAIIVASAGITGTFNGPFADGMSPFAPCVVLRVTARVATVVMRLDWPTGDSVWYGAAVGNGYAIVSAWMGGTIGVPVDIDLTTVRTQVRAFDAGGHELRVG
jgi:hypothetical protein